MSGYRVSLCVLLTVSLLSWLPATAKAQDTDQGLDYSTKLQQFLLQKIKEAETWDEYDEFEDLPQAKKGRQGNIEDNDDDQSEIIDDEIEEGSSEVESSGNEDGSEADDDEEVIVINTAPFRMSSLVSGLSTDIELQEVTGSDLLTMVCRVTVDGQSDIFNDTTCLPQIYLVSGQSDCNSLSQAFSAKKLANIHEPGEGKTTVDATWSELPGKCVVVLRKNDCEDSGDDEEDVAEQSDDADTIVDTRRQFRANNVLTAAGFGRSYTTFSLSSFSILSSGTTSVFTISKPSISYSGPIPAGIVATKYDRLATLPYLQLSGWTQREAIFIVLFMIAIYFVYAYISANLISIEPLRRKFFNEAQLARFDAINDGMSLIADTYLMSLSSPWRKIAQNIDNNLLKKPQSNKNKFLQNLSSQRSDISTIDRM